MNIIIIVIVGILSIIVGAIVGILAYREYLSRAVQSAQLESRKILEEARKEADRIIKVGIRETKEEARKRRQTFEDEIKQRRSEILKLENKIKQREVNLEKKLELLEAKETELNKLNDLIQQEDQRYKRLISEYEKSLEQNRRMLQHIANMSVEEAKDALIKSVEAEARKEAEIKLKEIEEQVKKEADLKARTAVSIAIQRTASNFVNEATVSVVSLPSDDMKGRIIGREGRNIRAIEQYTGVDVIIDDTPEAVIISCFNPIRREIAKIALEKLIADGRIHPARIQETINKVKEEFEQIIIENGEQAIFEVGITNIHPQLIKKLGALKYYISGQQTLLQHSLEVANICGIMAAELKLNIKKAKRLGLLHDIGQVADQEYEGHHAVVGADMCAKFGEDPDIVLAIKEHHAEDLTNISMYGLILHTANLLAISRPGSRKEIYEAHIKRLTDIENVVKGMDNIKEAFVFQAGKEVRAIVNPIGLSDKDVTNLARDIAEKLKTEVMYPGHIKVTVVNEKVFSDIAK